jgi:hypothetical protein
VAVDALVPVLVTSSLRPPDSLRAIILQPMESGNKRGLAVGDGRRFETGVSAPTPNFRRESSGRPAIRSGGALLVI